MAAQAVVEQHIPATVKLPQSLWKRVRTKAIWEGRTVGAIVQEALEEKLEAEHSNGKADGKKRSGGA